MAKHKMAAAVGAAEMDDAEMEQVSAKAKAEAEARASGAPSPSEGGTIRVSVRAARAHFRGGRFWPAAADEGAVEADVTEKQLELLLADRELLVDTK
jgi:hypothetical protein